MPNLVYSVGPFLPFTKIVSADMNAKLNDIKTLLNTTKLDSTNVQLNGLTRDRLAIGTPDYVAINDGTGNLSEEAQLDITRGGLGQDFTPSFATNVGSAIIVNNTADDFTLGSPFQPALTETPASPVPTLTAGEAILTNETVCLDLALDASSNYEYRVFKTDLSKPGRRASFLGFSLTDVSVTSQVQTFVASANFVASNVVSYTINGRVYSTTFSTSNSFTLAAIATQIAADPDVSSAVSDGVHTITVTTEGAIYANFTNASVTGGVSQPTITITQTIAPVGGAVLIRSFGPLTPVSGITTSQLYYLDAATAGGITTAPTDNAPIAVGQALSSTVLFVTPNSFYYQFTINNLFIKGFGNNSTGDGTVTDTEHFNFSTWFAGTSSGLSGRCDMGGGEYTYQQYLMQLDGQESSAGSSPTAQFQQYNKSTWFTLTDRATGARYANSCKAFNGMFFAVGGLRAGTAYTNVDQWNGVAWGAGTALGGGQYSQGLFVQGGILRSVAGFDDGGGTNVHRTYTTGGVVGTSTVAPFSDVATGGSECGVSAVNGYVGRTQTTDSYVWNGSSWSSTITVTYKINAAALNQCTAADGYRLSANLAYINGGQDVSKNPFNTTASFNGTTWNAGTSSSSSRRALIGGIV